MFRGNNPKAVHGSIIVATIEDTILNAESDTSSRLPLVQSYFDLLNIETKLKMPEICLENSYLALSSFESVTAKAWAELASILFSSHLIRDLSKNELKDYFDKDRIAQIEAHRQKFIEFSASYAAYPDVGIEICKDALDIVGSINQLIKRIEKLHEKDK